MPTIISADEFYRGALQKDTQRPEGYATVQAILRCLADPVSKQQFPALPMDHFQAIDFWEGALFLFTFMTGWSNPWNGLNSYLSHHLKLTPDEPVWTAWAKLYAENADLDLLAEFLHTSKSNKALALRALSHGRTATFSDGKYPPGDAWLKEFKKKYPRGGTDYPSPLWGDGTDGPQPDALHMGHVIDWAATENRTNSETALLLRTDPAARRAVFCIDSLLGWYASLSRLGRDLPDLGERSWLVDVFARDTGWLGTFRRSRETGLWFTGRHSTHMVGN